MKISVLLDRARDHALPVLSTISDDQLTNRTPCADYDVRALIDHVMHVVVEFQKLAAKQNADFATTPSYADWRARFPAETEQLVEAWGRPGADEGVSGQMNLPATVVGSMALLDLTVHAWDLARATGQRYEADAEVITALDAFVEQMGPMARQEKVFGEPVDVETDDALEALLAKTGRDPRWSA